MLRERSTILGDIRGFFAEREVVEVHTPVLARYGVTDPDVPGIRVADVGVLQTSPEYHLKRLLAAGLGDCYQMGPVFRADEQGSRHNREFTLLEWYRLGFDHHDLMAEVAQLVDLILGSATYRTLTYADLVGDLEREREVLDLAFAEASDALQGRCFITEYPADQAALARLEPANPGRAARFELVIDGLELANGYWELTDADEHRRRFLQDNRIRAERGLTPMALDEPFLASLDAGLPDCAGVALGVDRLVMLALGCGSIEEVLTFR